MKLPIAAAVLSTTICCSCFAQSPNTGRYVNASLGFNTLGDQTLDVALGDQNPVIAINGASGSGKASFDASFGSGAALGYRFANGFSVEGEFIYRTVDLSSVDLGAVGAFSDGNLANTQFNVNGYYHFNLFDNTTIDTYVGAGLAYINEVDIDFEANGNEISFETDEVAVELMAGARYHLWERAFMDAGVRYMPVGGITMELGDAGGTVKTDYEPLMLTLKVGWQF